jgi:hypothetical protein
MEESRTARGPRRRNRDRRICKEQIPAGATWRWFLHVTGASPNSGTADTLEEAQAALTVSYEQWRGRA